MSNRYVTFEKTGPPEVLEIKEEPIPQAKGSEIVVKNEAIGFNFIDTYFRSGIYPTPLPARGGSEGAGYIHELGPDVDPKLGFKKGDKVLYLGRDAYADYTVAPGNRVAKLPEGISFEVAASSLLKGLTVQYLIEQIYVPKKDEVVLFHAGAGGVGLIFLQWAASLGVKTITTTSTDEKAELAKKHGAYATFKYSDDLPAEVQKLNNGEKVKVVYDSVGKSTFTASLDSLAPLGLMISFGNASGLVPPFSLNELASRGSLSITRPTLGNYIFDFQKQVDAFYKLVQDGTIKIDAAHTYKLTDVQQLHRDAESRKLTGSSVLIP